MQQSDAPNTRWMQTHTFPGGAIYNILGDPVQAQGVCVGVSARHPAQEVCKGAASLGQLRSFFYKPFEIKGLWSTPGRLPEAERASCAVI